MKNCGMGNYKIEDAEMDKEKEETEELVKEVERLLFQNHDVGEESGNDARAVLWRTARCLTDIMLNILIAIFPILIATVVTIMFKKRRKKR